MDVKLATEQFPQFLREAHGLGTVDLPQGFSQVILAGMGDSGVVAEALASFVKRTPVTVVKSYQLPGFADAKTLVILISYSGNSEELISLYGEARRKNCPLLIVSSAGKLREIALHDKVQTLKLPTGLLSRSAFPYIFVPLWEVLYKAKVLDEPIKDIDMIKQALTSPQLKQRANELASNIVDKVLLIYASPKLLPVAMRWKTMINQNAKVHVFINSFPDVDYAELEGFSNCKADYFVVLMHDEQDSLRIKKRVEVTKNILADKNINTTEIAVTGKYVLTRVLSALYLGDLVSVALAEKYAVNVNALPLIEALREGLK